MNEFEIKRAVREYMEILEYEILNDPKWITLHNLAHVDDVFVPRNLRQKSPDKDPIVFTGPNGSVIMEYKGRKGPGCLQGIGQLLYYSTESGLEKCCLAISAWDYWQVKSTLSRVPWLAVLTVNKGEYDELIVSCQRWFPSEPIPMGLVLPSSLPEEGTPKYIARKLGIKAAVVRKLLREKDSQEEQGVQRIMSKWFPLSPEDIKYVEERLARE